MSSLWDRYQKYFLRNDALGFSLDISRMRFGDDFLPKMEPLAQKAFASMKELESMNPVIEEPRTTSWQEAQS